MKWLVTGAHGMLGRDLSHLLEAAGRSVTMTDRADLDITDPDETMVAVAGYDVVANCAAWTDVDGAEKHEPEAFAINAVGPANLARAAKAHGARLVQVSTDYVFGGQAVDPYVEASPVSPRNAYARTKLAGEWAVQASGADAIILRTAWLYGVHGPSFPRAIMNRLAAVGVVDVVDDQRGQPTWTRDVADLVVRLIDADAPAGAYHGTSLGEATWFDFAIQIAGSYGTDPACVRPTSSAGSPRPAARPAYSVLGHGALERIGVEPIGHWRERWSVAAPDMVAATRHPSDPRVG
jgi:dTDP-4-dehydrorhamnose reductase